MGYKCTVKIYLLKLGGGVIWWDVPPFFKGGNLVCWFHFCFSIAVEKGTLLLKASVK